MRCEGKGPGMINSSIGEELEALVYLFYEGRVNVCVKKECVWKGKWNSRDG